MSSFLSDSTPSLISPWTDLRPDHPCLSVGVLASGAGSNFTALARAIQEGRLQACLRVVVYNQATAGVAQRARDEQVPAVFIDHRRFPEREPLDAMIVDTLRKHQVEWVVMAGWMRVVTPVLIDAFAGRIINIHPSLLPSFPGLRAVEQALAAGVKISGCTVHHVSPEVDRGPIICQAAVPVLDQDTPSSLHERIQVQEHRILPLALSMAARLAVSSTQPPAAH